MKKQKIEPLGIELMLDEGVNFFDDGFVRSGIEKSWELVVNYGANPDEYMKNYIFECKGNCLPFETPEGFNVHIFYMDQGSDLENAMTRGHEAAHALRFLPKRTFIEFVNESLEFLEVKREKKLYEEDLVNACAIYSLAKNRIYSAAEAKERFDEEYKNGEEERDGIFAKHC